METEAIPKLSEVETVRLCISCECVIGARGSGDRDPERDLQEYFKPIADVTGEDDPAGIVGPEESEYDSEWQVFTGQFSGDLTAEQWERVARDYCLDLGEYGEDDPPALPDSFEPTMGILGYDGITPAVAIPHTDEGWGDFSGEPTLLASFYVALKLRA